MVRPAFGDILFSQTALGVINITKQLEQDKIKVHPKPIVACPYPAMNLVFAWALQQVQPFAYFIDLFEGFEKHPHLNFTAKYRCGDLTTAYSKLYMKLTLIFFVVSYTSLK